MYNIEIHAEESRSRLLSMITDLGRTMVQSDRLRYNDVKHILRPKTEITLRDTTSVVKNQVDRDLTVGSEEVPY